MEAATQLFSAKGDFFLTKVLSGAIFRITLSQEFPFWLWTTLEFVVIRPSN